MFIKDTKINNNGLVFIKSKNIKVFPCGRRRSGIVDPDSNSETVSDRYYIPFDPEARLNTEANNRKHSGLNGFKQKYISRWDSTGNISLVLAGYLFNIVSGYSSVAEFGAALAAAIEGNPRNIFVNIKLADVTFFAGSDTVPKATTEILRDQYTSQSPLECLDQLYGDQAKKEDKENPDNYYFYGLSFSSERLESSEGSIADTTADANGWVSLQLLDRDGDTWKIHESSRLPKIDHGNTHNSIKLFGDLELPGSLTAGGNASVGGTLAADTINANAINITKIIDNKPVVMSAVTLKVEETTEGSNTWQLKFYT